jgi:hypothetical protein
MLVFLVATTMALMELTESVQLRGRTGDPLFSNSTVFHNSSNKIWRTSAVLQDPLVDQLFTQQRIINVLVVGACDGSLTQSNDPVINALTKTNVRAWMVEPNPPVYDMLVQNLKQYPAPERLQPLKVAICPYVNGQKDFYVVDESFAQDCPNAPHWAKYQLSSMDRKTVSKHWPWTNCGFKSEAEFDAFIKKIQVPCWTPPTLLSTANLQAQQVDLLVTDTEGFDAHIVKAFMRQPGFNPSLIIYEHKHLGGAAQGDVKALLQQRGYKLRIDPWDTFASRR